MIWNCKNKEFPLQGFKAFYNILNQAILRLITASTASCSCLGDNLRH
jgi:hypothetical protein